MRTEASLRSRLLIGAGVLLVVGVIAFPHRPTQITHWRVPEPSAARFDAADWFALPAGVEGFALLSEDLRWRQAGPLRLDEATDGSARLTGLLVGLEDDTLRLQLDLHLSDRDHDGATVAQPGDYGDVSGYLRGLGQLDGALVRVRSGGEAPLETTARRGAFGLLCEWIEPPRSGARPGSEGVSNWTLPVEFAEQAVWGVPSLALELGSYADAFELLSGGRLVERADGSATLSAVVAQRGYESRAFQLDLHLGQSEPESPAPIEDTSSNPLAGPSGLFDDGSLDDETFWRAYDRCTGALVGLGDFAGARVRIGTADGGVRVGLGAGPANERYGASGTWTTVVEQQPDDDELTLRPGRSTAEFGLGLSGRAVQFALAPTGDHPAGDESGVVLELGPLGNDWVFAAGGTFFEHSDGGARLVGLLERANGGPGALWLDAEFRARDLAGRTTTEGRRELETWAYVEDGGPVHPQTWQLYGEVDGRLSGLGELAGLELELERTDAPVQVGVGANGCSLAHGGSARLALTAGEASSVERELPETAVLRFELRGSCDERVAPRGDAPALHLQGIGDDFHFLSGGRLEHGPDERARLTGLVARRSFPNHRFFVDLRCEGRAEPAGAGDARSGWGGFAQVEGRLIGLETFDGALLEVWGDARGWRMGPGEAGALEASAELQLTVLRQPRGDWVFRSEWLRGGVDLALSRTLASGAEEAYALLSVPTPAGHALYLPGVAEDLAFPSGGSFVEHADGTATLTGHARSVSEPRLGFDVRIDFEGRFDDHRLANVERGLPSSAYIEQGGPVDPRLWRFYRSARGILVGTDALSGAVLELGSDEDALQVGLGANGRNLQYGASGDQNVRVLGQPIGGDELLPDYLPGAELHLDLPALREE